MLNRWWLYLLSPFLLVALLGTFLAGFTAVLAYPNLPTLEALTDYQPKVPLRVYSAEGIQIGEFGEERRALVRIDAVPVKMLQAIIAAEDERFYRHKGVDYIGVLRAAYSNFAAGGTRQGASTITMQVARNFFLSKEKTLMRKFNEALLAFKIEHSLSKDEILQLYINQIYLGQRAYGFAAAAQIYFGKNLEHLNLAEMAVLAGLPKAPSTFNPVVNPERSKLRQRYVLRRMLELGYVTQEDYDEATTQVIAVTREQKQYLAGADYIAEMVRQAMFERYHDDAYAKGFKVFTTLRKSHQEAAYAALRDGVDAHDKRHGYRGPEGFFDLSGQIADENLEEMLQDQVENVDFRAAIVLEANQRFVKIYRKGGGLFEIAGDGLSFVQKFLGSQVAPNQRIRRGALVRVHKTPNGNWEVAQLPAVEAALVAINPWDGAILSLVGGFDFNLSQFNHVTQAFRQPGSCFKPFIYSAALEKGFTPATIVQDAPITFDAEQTGSKSWEPKNYEDEYAGPMRLRPALAKSKNMVSIRVLQAIGPQYAQDYITRFGFDPELHPPYLTLALGAGSATPLQLVAGYAVFANGGYKVKPYFIDRIEDARGATIVRAKPLRAGEGAQRVIDVRNAFIMGSLMQDVIRVGTGSRAMQLGRNDLAGKTGTTNDLVDAWFSGYQRNLVAVSWIGFDNPHTLGKNETGAQAALPIWMNYMGKVLKNVPEELSPVPEGVVATNIDPDTGLRTPGNKGGLLEYFFQESVPAEVGADNPPGGTDAAEAIDKIKDQIL